MLAREGCVPVSVVAVAAAGVAVVWSPLLSVPGFLLLLVVVRVFWECEPQIPAIPFAVLSPVDGRVVSVGETSIRSVELVAAYTKVENCARKFSTLRINNACDLVKRGMNHFGPFR